MNSEGRNGKGLKALGIAAARLFLFEDPSGFCEPGEESQLAARCPASCPRCAGEGEVVTRDPSGKRVFVSCPNVPKGT